MYPDWLHLRPGNITGQWEIYQPKLLLLLVSRLTTELKVLRWYLSMFGRFYPTRLWLNSSTRVSCLKMERESSVYARTLPCGLLERLRFRTHGATWIHRRPDNIYSHACLYWKNKKSDSKLKLSNWFFLSSCHFRAPRTLRGKTVEFAAHTHVSCLGHFIWNNIDIFADLISHNYQDFVSLL